MIRRYSSGRLGIPDGTDYHRASQETSRICHILMMHYEGEYPEEAPFTIGELEEIYPTASGKAKEDDALP